MMVRTYALLSAYDEAGQSYVWLRVSETPNSALQCGSCLKSFPREAVIGNAVNSLDDETDVSATRGTRLAWRKHRAWYVALVPTPSPSEGGRGPAT